MELLSTDEFIRRVGERDGGRCVLCGDRAIEVVHVMAEKLWDDGGCYAENGVSLCAQHAQAARTTEIAVDLLVEAAGLPGLLLPEQLHAVQRYDRWGNPMLADGKRARGELFYDPEAAHWLALGNMLDRFAHWVKYPRTYVLPWSDSIGEGDRSFRAIDRLRDTRVIATEKMDGENVTLYRDFLHTRSVARIDHPSRAWLNAYWESMREGIPEGWRICGEYLYVAHSVTYTQLRSFFLAFSVWNERNICLNWDESLLFLNRIGVSAVLVLYDGRFDQEAIHLNWQRNTSPQSEGYIVRSAGDIAYGDFRNMVGKYIRAGYVQSEPVRNNMKDGTPFESNVLASD
jgi:hypothetical protein